MHFVAGPSLPASLAAATAAGAQPQQQQQARWRRRRAQHRASDGGSSSSSSSSSTGGYLFALPPPQPPAGHAPFSSVTVSALQGAKAAQNGLLLLPVTTRRGGKRRQYAWDGRRIKPVNTALLGDGYTPSARLLDQLAALRRGLAAAFVPRSDDVTPDYWQWLRWRLGQRFCSAVVLNFATQSLLTAVGVGAQRALAASAAINWMLKDGISRLVRMAVATQWGGAFDADLKRFRYCSSIAHAALLSCEFAAPFAPGSFLLLASVSNIGRAVGLTTFVSTQPAFQQALCAGGRMADLASKTQAQHMVMDTLALAVVSAANYALRHNEARRRLLPVLAFPLLSALDLYCIYRELKAVQLRTLNRERGEAVAQRWADTHGREVATFAEVAAKERLVLPPRVCGHLLPLRILPLERVARSPAELDALLAGARGARYVLSVRGPERLPPLQALADGLWERYRTVPHVAVALAENAGPDDVATALLHAALLRRAVIERLEAGGALPPPPPAPPVAQQQDYSSTSSDSDAAAAAAAEEREARARAAAAAVRAGAVSEAELARCAADAGRRARREARRFVADATAAGWRTRPLLLSPLERTGYAT